MAKKTLSKELEKQDPEELLRLLQEVARRFPVAKMYLNMEFGLDSEAILAKYQKAILKEYYPTRGRGKARISKVNRILKEFSLVSAFKEDLMEIYWYQISLAIQYLVDYRPDGDPFLLGLMKNWATFWRMVKAEGARQDFEEKVEAVFSKERFQRHFMHDSLLKIREQVENETEEEPDLSDE